MKLTAEIDGEKLEAVVTRDGERVVAVIDGRHYELEVRRTGEGGYLLTVEGRIYDCLVGRLDGQRPHALEVLVGGNAYQVNLTDPKRLRSAQSAGSHADASAAQIVAPMPGKIVRVLVEKGAEVEAGDGLIVVEAMKMQNEMKSPKAGTVVAINVEAGATVNGGDVLAIIE